jgi:hypothetical protein
VATQRPATGVHTMVAALTSASIPTAVVLHVVSRAGQQKRDLCPHRRETLQNHGLV